MDRSKLASFLAGSGMDGYLFDSAGFDANQYYLTDFTAPDGVVSLHTPEDDHVLTTTLEYGRAESESSADTVAIRADYGERDLRGEYSKDEAINRVIGRFLADHDVDAVSVPAEFPVGTADSLRDQGVDVDPVTADVFDEIRAVKRDEEVERIRAVQAANEEAMATVERLLREATVADGSGDVAAGTLVHDGEPLTSERVKTEVEVTLLRERCGLDEAIVACGADGTEPHNRGSGPLVAGEPIVVDIFPKSKETRYYGDMTRTFVKGQPGDRAREWYDLTREAFEAALDAVQAGATGADVHAAACDVYEDAGLPTLRSDPDAETGFIHSTGHGVGLEIHEDPRLDMHNDDPLQVGQVITVEPGLYDPEVGGIRIEDLVVVTEEGYENLTDYPVEFVVE